MFAILQGVKHLNGRVEAGRHYTLFLDSQAAISRIGYDRCGPAQASAKAISITVDKHSKRGNTLYIRWTAAHTGVEGNEQADETAKSAAEGKEDRADRANLMQESLFYLIRKATETRSTASIDWIRLFSGCHRSSQPPKNGKLRTGLGKVRKELAGYFNQLLTGHV